jgi:hypothetical protein
MPAHECYAFERAGSATRWFGSLRRLLRHALQPATTAASAPLAALLLLLRVEASRASERSARRSTIRGRNRPGSPLPAALAKPEHGSWRHRHRLLASRSRPAFEPRKALPRPQVGFRIFRCCPAARGPRKAAKTESPRLHSRVPRGGRHRPAGIESRIVPSDIEGVSGENRSSVPGPSVRNIQVAGSVR